MTFLPIDRRRLLIGGAAALTALAARPRLSYAAVGDTLLVRGKGDIECLDPAFQKGLIEEEVIRALFVTLNRLADIRQGIEWTPYAAADLTALSGSEIGFTLEDWLAWTNGFGPVTAEDVKFSFERVANPANASPWAYAFEALDRVEVSGARTGTIHLKEAYSPFWVTTLPYYMGHIVCRAAVEKAGGKFTTDVPASCGPYVIADWQPKQSLSLGPNPDWKGPKPAFSKVRFETVVDDEAAALAFEAKAIDYTRVSLNSLVAFRKETPADASLIDMNGTRFVWLTINLGNPKFADERVRRALQYALDVAPIMDGAYSGLAAPATGVVPPGMVGHREAILYPADAAKAKALLAEAGVADLTVELAMPNDTTSLLTGQIVQALMSEIGIAVELKPTDDAVYWTLGDKSAGDGWKSLEMVLMSFAGGVDPSENLTWFRPNQIGVYNWSQFDSPEFEALYQEGSKETDADKRDTIYRQMQDLMEQSGGFVFLTHEVFAAISRAGLEPCILADGYLDVTRFTRT